MKTIDIKGKPYVMANERIKYFRDNYPDGAILTELISDVDGKCIFKAEIIVDDKCVATGYAYENENSTFINKTSYIENCETSAVGRALGNFGIGIDDSLASFEEVANAISTQNTFESNTIVDKQVVGFGKNKGKKWSEVDDGFLDWVINNFNNADVVEVAKVEKEVRKPMPSKNDETPNAHTANSPVGYDDEVEFDSKQEDIPF